MLKFMVMQIWIQIVIMMLAPMVLTVKELARTPVIQLPAGKIRGVVTPDSIRGFYNSYLGIPFAKVEKRFQVATPIQSWEGILEANNDSIKCFQVDFPPFYLIQENTNSVNVEDCLRLHVFTPMPLPGSQPLKPVMVFIYGGGFITGTSSPMVYGPEYFLRNDVIVVNINYRVDVLGFLCLDIKEAPGNVGFKDQVEALRWVKRNIKAFGGDPDNITIFGESSGAGSAMLHALSPMSQGLFNKVIAQSGSSLASWAIQYEPLTTAIRLARLMGFYTHDPIELYNIFMNQTAEQLLSFRIPRYQGETVFGTFVYGACVEKQIHGGERFLTDLPINLITSRKFAKVPMIIGHNSDEGQLFASLESPSDLYNITFIDALPRDLAFHTLHEAKEIADTLEAMYMKGKPITADTALLLAEYEGDFGMIYPVIALADLMMRYSNQPVYLYNFVYSGLLNFFKYQTGFKKSLPGATHVDEIFYLFKHALSDANELVESGMIQKMSTMWTNFAKFGEPVPLETPLLPKKWHPTTEDNPTKFVIDECFSSEPMWNSRLLYFNHTYTYNRKTTLYYSKHHHH